MLGQAHAPNDEKLFRLSSDAPGTVMLMHSYFRSPRDLVFSACSLTMLVTSSVHAQAIRQASGTVKDSSGAVVISAEVTLQDRKGRTLKRTATDPTGTFRLPLNSNSDSVVVVRSPGFQVRFIPSGVFDQRRGPLSITL